MVQLLSGHTPIMVLQLWLLYNYTPLLHGVLVDTCFVAYAFSFSFSSLLLVYSLPLSLRSVMMFQFPIYIEEYFFRCSNTSDFLFIKYTTQYPMLLSRNATKFKAPFREGFLIKPHTSVCTNSPIFVARFRPLVKKWRRWPSKHRHRTAKQNFERPWGHQLYVQLTHFVPGVHATIVMKAVFQKKMFVKSFIIKRHKIHR